MKKTRNGSVLLCTYIIRARKATENFVSHFGKASNYCNATTIPPTGRGAAPVSPGTRKQGTMRESTSPRRSRALVASTAVLLLCGGQHGVAEALTVPNAAGVGTPSASRMTAAASARGHPRGVSAVRMLSDVNAENISGNGLWKSRASPLFSSSGAAFAHRQPSDASATRLHAMVRPDIHTHPSIQVEHAVSFTREGWKHISGHVFPTYLFVQFLLTLRAAFCFLNYFPPAHVQSGRAAR